MQLAPSVLSAFAALCFAVLISGLDALFALPVLAGPFAAAEVGKDSPQIKSELTRNAGSDLRATGSISTDFTDNLFATDQYRQSLLREFSGRWRVTQLAMGEDLIMQKINSVLTNPAVITFTPKGHLYMTAGCRRRMGSVHFEAEYLMVGMVSRSGRGCHFSQWRIEGQIARRLDDARQWQLVDDQLILSDPDGKHLLSLSRVRF